MTQPNTINSLNTHDILVQYSPVAIAGSGIQQYTRNGQMDIERVHSKKKKRFDPHKYEYTFRRLYYRIEMN